MITYDGTHRGCAQRARAGTNALKRLLVVLALSAASAEARTFQDIMGTPVTEKIGDALARSVGRALPVVSASAGVVYSYDPASGAFERETSILGQLFLERGEPLGRNHLSLNVTYQYVEIETFEGKDIDTLEDTRYPIDDPAKDAAGPVTVPRFGVDLETHVATASVTYGLTDDADVNVAIPFVYSEFERRVIISSPEGLDSVDGGASKAGIGDIFLRAKHRLLSEARFKLSGGLVLRIPTGDEEDYQGTGDTELAPMLYASLPSWQPSGRLRIEPYLNAGYDFDLADLSRSEARWGVGVDLGLRDEVTAAVAVLGRHGVDRIAPAGLFSFRRTDGRSRPLFGLEGDRPDIYDLSVGARWNVYKDTVFVLLNAIVPLNDDGVRTRVTPLGGIEATF